jgi:hypothetical protein
MLPLLVEFSTNSMPTAFEESLGNGFPTGWSYDTVPWNEGPQIDPMNTDQKRQGLMIIFGKFF